jgi:hypothetical protein
MFCILDSRTMSSPPAIVTVTQTHTVTALADPATPTSTPFAATDPGTASDIPPPSHDIPPYPYPPSSPVPPSDQDYPYDPYFVPYHAPPPMALPPTVGPAYQAGAVMDPLTAIMAIVVVALMYWGFKSGGAAGLLQQYQTSRVWVTSRTHIY